MGLKKGGFETIQRDGHRAVNNYQESIVAALDLKHGSQS